MKPLNSSKNKLSSNKKKKTSFLSQCQTHTKPSIINSSQRSCFLINSVQKISQLNLQIYIYGNKPKAFHYNQLTQHYIYFKYYF